MRADTSKFEQEIKRAEGRLAVFQGGMSYVPAPPPLMIFTDRPTSQAAIEHIRSCLAETGKPIVITPGLTVYQCVDGRWERIGPDCQASS
jgi:hypothetical protein